MKSLKDCVELYSPMLSDIEIIKEYIMCNDLELEMLDMVAVLAKSKAHKVQAQLDYARTWIPYIMIPTKRGGEVYDKKTELRLTKIIQYHILGLDLPDWLLKWAKEEIPKMEVPFTFFVPVIEWLESKYNIKFKEDEKKQK